MFPDFLKDDPIHLKEFYVVLISVRVWGPEWSRKKVIIRCDNDAVCDTITFQKPSDAKLQACLRELLFWQCRYNFSLSVQKIGTKENFIADFISRCTDITKVHDFLATQNISKTHVPVPCEFLKFSGEW